MSEYVRPVIAERTYFDNDGRVIEYGNRPPDVGGDGLPRGTNMFTNEDRFLPIFTVADALIEHIQAEFDVTLSELTRFPNPFRTGEPQTTEDGDVYSRIIRIDPARADQAPLTIGFGRTPGQVDGPMSDRAVMRDVGRPFPRRAIRRQRPEWAGASQTTGTRLDAFRCARRGPRLCRRQR
jgi:hypothetical protein